MKKDILPDRKKNKEAPFLKRKNWNLCAGLVLVIWVILLFTVHAHTEDPSDLAMMIHSLPLISAAMFLLGYLDKRRESDDEAARNAARYRARMTLSRIQRENERLGKDQ